jgi:HPt (histidine-containing phosphotransfer) domain-containing protein
MINQQNLTDGKARILVHPPEDLPYRVVAAYLENCRKSLPSLKDATERLDYDFLSIYGHRMKGCGGAYGFPELTETGALIEEAAHVRNDGQLRSCAVALEAHLEAVEVVEP